MAQPRSSRTQILMYLAFVFPFSSFFYFPLIRSVSIRNGRGLYVLSLMLGLMWSPALAGMLTLWLNGRSVAELGWRWGKTKYQVWSWFIPVLYASIAYAIVWIVGSAGLAIQNSTMRWENRCIWEGRCGSR